MSGWVIAGIAILAFVAWTIRLNRRLQTKHRRLAASRSPHDETSFVEAMAVEGVSATTAHFLWADLKVFYFEPLRPSPEDRTRSMLDIDPDDICDVAENFWNAMLVHTEFDHPIQIPDDLSVAELGRFLDDQVAEGKQEQREEDLGE